MKTSILVVAVALVEVFLTRTANSLPTVQPRTLRRQALAVQVANVSNLECGGVAASCSDCSTVLSCTKVGSDFRPVSTTTCPTAKPYCSAGACTATYPDDENCNKPPQASNDFICYGGDGYFPDPANCKLYHLCVDGLAYTYDCSQYSNTFYSHSAAMCVPTSETQCSTVSCGTSTIGKYQFYKQDNSVYFVCTDTKPANAYVAACPEDYKMDTEGNCVLTCLREGRLPHEDNTKYYECIKTGANTYRGPSPATCPTGSTFDVASKRCVSL